MDFYDRFLVAPGRKAKFTDANAAYTAGFESKQHAQADLDKNIARLGELQDVLYAQARHAVLIVLQAMDAGGKDGTIRHVMTGLNPQSCHVTSFKQPSHEELAHDFLWRIHMAVPRRGEIGIFNRSHYEDVLVVRVHELVEPAVWKRRYEQINEFEHILAANDVLILKFFLHISRGEQLKRLRDRIDDPTKQWKIAPEDFAERRRWDDYQQAYRDAIEKCSTKHAPWFVIPSDHKWFRNLAVSQIIVAAMESLKMKYPKPKLDLRKIRVK